MRRALPVARTLPLATAFALTPRRPPVPAYYMPDFLVPPPVSPVATLSEELERLRATPQEQVRADVMRMLGSSEPPAVLAELLEDAPRALGQLADALGAYWADVIEPEWPRIRALLDADLAYRAQRLTTGGHASLFGDLNRLVRFSESRLELELITDATVGLRGQGLLLVPSVFQWERPAVIYDAPWQPTLLYPARGVALLWEAERPQPGAALAGVLGSTRAQVLVTLDAPRTTTELARWLGVRASGVSADHFPFWPRDPPALVLSYEACPAPTAHDNDSPQGETSYCRGWPFPGHGADGSWLAAAEGRRALLLWGSHGVRRGVAHGSVGGVRR
jgi:Family of unknown function (DUF5937)